MMEILLMEKENALLICYNNNELRCSLPKKLSFFLFLFLALQPPGWLEKNHTWGWTGLYIHQRLHEVQVTWLKCHAAESSTVSAPRDIFGSLMSHLHSLGFVSVCVCAHAFFHVMLSFLERLVLILFLKGFVLHSEWMVDIASKWLAGREKSWVWETTTGWNLNLGSCGHQHHNHSASPVLMFVMTEWSTITSCSTHNNPSLSSPPPKHTHTHRTFQQPINVEERTQKP